MPLPLHLGISLPPKWESVLPLFILESEGAVRASAGLPLRPWAMTFKRKKEKPKQESLPRSQGAHTSMTHSGWSQLQDKPSDKPGLWLGTDFFFSCKGVQVAGWKIGGDFHSPSCAKAESKASWLTYFFNLYLCISFIWKAETPDRESFSIHWFIHSPKCPRQPGLNQVKTRS